MRLLRLCLPIAIFGLLALSSQAAVDVAFTQIDANGLPLIFSTVKVSQNGQPLGNLTDANFKIYEDDVQMLTDFKVYPPEQGGEVRLVDFVFLIDNSGSMSDKIAAVRNNVNAFADGLRSRGFDLRLGAVKFGQSAGANPFIINSGNMTADVEVFKSWVNAMSANGGYEPGLQAIEMANQQFAFRPGAARHFLIITDEDSDAGSLSNAIALCKTNNVVVHGAINCSFDQSYAHYCSPSTSITGATGGLVMSVAGPYSQIFDRITGAINNTYIVRYETPNPQCNGTARQVRVEVTVGSETGSATRSYTPCTGPRIVRTPETIVLTRTAQTEGTNLTIKAWITDQVAPSVVSTSLFYRKKGDPLWTEVKSTSPVGPGGEYHWAIPGAVVRQPAVDYYITATDGQQSASDPAVDPQIEPYDIAVLPNEKPVVVHTPVATAPVNAPIRIECTASDVTNQIDKVYLYYQKGKNPSYSYYPSKEMTHGSGNTYTGDIPADFVTTEGLRYYIKAKDDLGTWSEMHGPHDVSAEEALDTDGDGLLDEWETTGYDVDGDGVPELVLNRFGCSPQHKDILLEIDYQKDDHRDFSGKPDKRAIDDLVKAFSEAPVDNPDGRSGINLIVDFDGRFDSPELGGSLQEITPAHELVLMLPSNEDWSAFMDYRNNANYFSPLRRKLFHYCILGKDLVDRRKNPCTVGQEDCSHPSGISQGVPGRNFYVALRQSNSSGNGYRDLPRVTGTIMHELGHNLGLGHGAPLKPLEETPDKSDDNQIDLNYLPNRLSVMNYDFQSGVFASGRAIFQYSEWGAETITDLDERKLSETSSMLNDRCTIFKSRYRCNGDSHDINDLSKPVDWNCDNVQQASLVEANINGDAVEGVAQFNTLKSYNDWKNLIYTGIRDVPTTQSPTHADYEPSTSCATLEELNSQKPFVPDSLTSLAGFGSLSYAWVPLYDPSDSSITYEILRESSSHDQFVQETSDSTLPDSTLRSGQHYQIRIRSKSLTGVFSDPSDAIIHETYNFYPQDQMLDKHDAAEKVRQGSKVVLSFKLSKLNGQQVADADYKVWLTSYKDKGLTVPAWPGVRYDFENPVTRYDAVTGVYQIEIDTKYYVNGFWGGKLLLDDGTSHWFGFEIIPRKELPDVQPDLQDVGY